MIPSTKLSASCWTTLSGTMDIEIDRQMYGRYRWIVKREFRVHLKNKKKKKKKNKKKRRTKKKKKKKKKNLPCEPFTTITGAGVGGGVGTKGFTGGGGGTGMPRAC